MKLLSLTIFLYQSCYFILAITFFISAFHPTTDKDTHMNLSQLDVRSNLNASSGSSIYLEVEDNKYFIPNFSNSNVSDFLASHVSLDIKEPKNFNVTVRSLVIKMWHNMMKMMGFIPECRNDGMRGTRGDCVCPKHYEGEFCEKIICENSGMRVKLSHYANEEVCRCPDPDYITGKHCEIINCQNGGQYIDGSCKCSDGWYTGKYCQYYTSSWLVAIGVLVILLFLIVSCCIVCQLDLFLRKTVYRGSPRTSQPSSYRCSRRICNASNQIRRQRTEESGERFRRPQQQCTMLRLERCPIYNPQLLPYSPEYRDLNFMEKPPPYEMAIHNCPIIVQDQPPIYSQSDPANNNDAQGLV